ncbi:transcriptional regulator [Geoglobus acetivorans]|uniref:Winged helix DNA-binding domain-containing protein n=1 Tax=Geoglobus acetivorans TaxID=565033 RepID=A0A0A7GJQ1_GEOAI|nr:hypothetical protein GACE_2134 [Geoglobus acetivorans]
MEPLSGLRHEILGNPVRLGIMLYLLSRGRAAFSEIQRVLELTPGNLDSHLKTLEKAGMIGIKKVIADRPRTVVEITEKGVDETWEYVRKLKDALEGL